MGNIQGQFNVGSFYNITAAAPLDVRTLVKTELDLIAEDSWNKKTHPPYKGMMVTVQETGNVYTLIDVDNVHSIDGWKKVGSSVTPDWYAKEGEPGYIKNKPFGANIKLGVLNDLTPYIEVSTYYDLVFIKENRILASVKKDYVGNITLTSGPPTYCKVEIVTDHSSIYKKLTLINNGNYHSESNPVYVFASVIPLDERYIPDTVVKTTLQSLSDTDKNQVLANLGIQDKLDKLVNVTYNELVELRNNSQLIAGMQYRITDYITTTVQKNTQSAGHPFDVIVLALTESKLCEEAYAAIHEGDTYFANSNLAAWKVWYCLDNDAERFAWAAPDNGETTVFKLSILNQAEEPIRCPDKDMTIGDTKYYCWKHKYGAELNAYTSTEDPSPETPVLTPEFIDYDEDGKSIYEMTVFESAYFINETVISEPGKGVIYRLIDEFGNDLPYDFKNILYLADYDKVKMIIEYDYSGRLTDKTAELVYSDDRNVKIYDADSDSDTVYYAWRVYDTDGNAEGICFTLTPFDCVDSNTTIYEYIPPTDEEIEAAKKAYEDAKAIQEASALFMEGGENLIEPLSIEAGIGGNNTTAIGKFVELSNIRIIDIHKGLKQYTFGDEYSDIEKLTDYSMNTVKEKSVINNIMQPLFNNGKCVLNNNLFTFASNNIILSNCSNIDKSSLTFETEDDVKSTNDTEFAKAYSKDSSNVMESIEMDYDDTYSLCLNYFYNDGYGYGYGGGSGDTPWVVDIPTGDFVCKETTTPMDVVFSNENGDKIITNDFTTVPDDYEPIGVVVIPASHDVYGTGECCVMSLNKMSCDTPDTGSIDNDDIICFGYSTENAPLNSYNSVPITDDGGFSLSFGYYFGYLPYDLYKEDSTLCDPLTSYEFESDHAIPSPYLGSDRNPIYYADSSYALSDFNGKENTRVLTDLITVPNWKTNNIILDLCTMGHYPAAACCWRYSTLGTNCGDWYLPAIGEVGYIIVRQKAINETLTNIKKYFNKHTQKNIGNIWSSTKYDDYYQWCCSSINRVEYYYSDSNLCVRACYRLKP